ncbi:MAG: methyltransferase domain-containing protein [Muriicola sp.]
MIRFKERSTENELMDDLSLDEVQIKAILKDITVANKWLGGNQITINALDRMMASHPKKIYTIMDMGCGDGSMLREVASQCKKKGVEVRLIGLDLNSKSIKIARELSTSFPDISYLQKDVFSLKPEEFECDILLCTLTLHHFSLQEIRTFVKKFAVLTNIGVIINDLDRSKIAYALFKVFSKVVIKTAVARHDGLVSIMSGFTKNDFNEFAKSVPEMSSEVTWRWAFRYEWTLRHQNT